MKRLISNKDNIKNEEITELIKRVKLLIINSKKEMLLGYANNTYQFPGGHVENNETLTEALNREISEEVGINLNLDIQPIACAINYYKDYPGKGKNRKNEIYYYIINKDIEPNLNNTNYTDNEKKGNFILKYIPIHNLEKELKDNISIYGDPYGIGNEMLKLLSSCKII